MLCFLLFPSLWNTRGLWKAFSGTKSQLGKSRLYPLTKILDKHCVYKGARFCSPLIVLSMEFSKQDEILD